MGTVIAWPSSALPKIEKEIVLGEARNWVVSIVMIGAALVPWFAGLLIALVLKLRKFEKIIFQQSHLKLSARNGP